MTTGIYTITFKNSDGFYIGQSINIEQRWEKHTSAMKHGNASRKLQEAYNTYGPPIYEILTICKKEELDSKEKFYIEEFDSINTGYNTCTGGNQYSGTTAPTSLYLKEELIKVITLLADDAILTVKEVSNISGVSQGIIRGILRGDSHLWISIEYVDLYKKAISLSSLREEKTKSIRGELLSSTNKGIVYPIIVNSKGEEFVITNARKFAIDNGIHPANLGAVLNGRRKSSGGFRLKDPDSRPIKTYKKYPLLYNTLTKETLQITSSLVKFSKQYNLDADSLSNLLNGSTILHRGIRLATEEESTKI